jgi:hypothetical protein
MKHGHGPPALLLGGLNMVRALGLGGIRVIVASPEPDGVAAYSRFACSSLLLRPLENRAAVVETLARAGERLAGAAGCRVPLFYSNDDYLSLVQENQAKVCEFFSWTDPLPFVRHCMSRARRIPRLTVRVKQWFYTAS